MTRNVTAPRSEANNPLHLVQVFPMGFWCRAAEVRTGAEQSTAEIATDWPVFAESKPKKRHVLYFGEINSSRVAAWRRAIEVFDEDPGRPRMMALLAEDRSVTVSAGGAAVQLRLSELRLCRPGQWSACWLAGKLRHELQRAGQRMAAALRMVRQQCDGRLVGRRFRFGGSTRAPCLLRPAAGAQGSSILASRGTLRDLFNVEFEVLLHDLTSTDVEVNASDLPDGTKPRHGYGRDKRPDCPQVMIALMVTPEGLAAGP